MARIEWDESVRLGFETIDEQHKGLGDTINRFHDAVAAGDDAALDELLSALERYARVHFATEEKLFGEFGYERAAAHREQHEAFMKQLASYRERHERGDFIAPGGIAAFLSAWLQEHVKSSDRKYAACFREHGLR